MSIDKIFKKIEDTKEKTCRILNNERTKLDKLLTYFFTFFEKEKKCGADWVRGEDKKRYDSFFNFLKNFDITPSFIKTFAEKIGEVKEEEKQIFGLYLSAMMQVSYNKGYNNFEFGKIKVDELGAFLKGREKEKIKIRLSSLEGDWNFWMAENCDISISRVVGNWNFWKMRECPIKIEKLNGSENIYYSEKCSFDLGKVSGSENLNYVKESNIKINFLNDSSFGHSIENSTVQSKDLNMLIKIKNTSSNKKNKYELIKK